MNDRLLFVVAPYAVAVTLLPIVLVRYVFLLRQPAKLQAHWLDARRFVSGGKAWGVALLVVLFAHVASVAAPQQLLLWNQVALRLLLLEATGFGFGLVALWGLLRVLRRQWLCPEGTTVECVLDTALLAVLFVQVVSGLAMAARYRWASSWSAVTLAPYLSSLLRLEPRLELMGGLPYLAKLHVFSAVVALALLPWTRLLHLVAFPLYRSFAALCAPLVQLARLTSARVDGWSRRAVSAASIWPEHEE